MRAAKSVLRASRKASDHFAALTALASSACVLQNETTLLSSTDAQVSVWISPSDPRADRVAPPDVAIAPPGRLGLPCTDPDGFECGLDLACIETLSGRFCSLRCEDTGDAGAEQRACGDGATCVSDGRRDATHGHCAVPCTALRGACRPGQACTTQWFARASVGDVATGCVPFCERDAQCGDGAACNTRTGRCVAAPWVADGLADGARCTVPVAAQRSPCVGECIPIAPGAVEGLCGSFVRRSSATVCPDAPELIAPETVERDDIARCWRRQCTATRCCSEGLQCAAVPLEARTGVCSFNLAPGTTVIDCAATDGGTDAGTDAAMDAAIGADR